MDYKQTLDFLYAQLPTYHLNGKTAYKANLNNALALDVYFGSPHLHYASIHVAGTNGKGSTSHLLSTALQAAGYKTGLFTSPHLIDFSERIKVNNLPIDQQSVVDFVAMHQGVIEDIRPSFFELTSAMALWYFKEQQVDIAIIEVGMGGRLDSTNIIHPILSVITNIGLDHTEFLGNNVAAIASEKAGIIKANTPIVIGEYDPITATVFNELACNKCAPIYYSTDMLNITGSQVSNFQTIQCTTPSTSFANGVYPSQFEVSIDLLAAYQIPNCLTALACLAVINQQGRFQVSLDQIKSGFAHVAQQANFAGRWQIVAHQPTIICDTGHNAHGLRYLQDQLKQQQYEQLYFVFGVVNDKDLSSILPLLPTDAYYLFTQAQIPRAMDAQQLTTLATDFGLKGLCVPHIADALKKASSLATKNDLILVGGSTFVVAEALASLA